MEPWMWWAIAFGALSLGGLPWALWNGLIGNRHVPLTADDPCPVRSGPSWWTRGANVPIGEHDWHAVLGVAGQTFCMRCGVVTQDGEVIAPPKGSLIVLEHGGGERIPECPGCGTPMYEWEELLDHAVDNEYSGPVYCRACSDEAIARIRGDEVGSCDDTR